MTQRLQIQQLQFFAHVSGEKQRRVKKLRAVDAAYIAGLIDGEGYIGVQRMLPKGAHSRSVQHRLLLQITNTDLDVLLWTRDQFGGIGSINVRQPARNASPKLKVCYQLRLTTRLAAQVLEQTVEYMHIKRGKALAALELCKVIRRIDKRGKPRMLTPEEIDRRDKLANMVSPRPQFLN